MSIKEISNKVDFLKWCTESNFPIVNDVVKIFRIGGVDIFLRNLEELNLNVNDNSPNGANLTIDGGRYGEISIHGNIKLTLTNDAVVDTIIIDKSIYQINIYNSKIKLLECKNPLVILDSIITKLKFIGNTLQIERSKIENLFIDTNHHLYIDVDNIKECIIKNNKYKLNDRKQNLISLRFPKKSKFFIVNCCFESGALFEHCDFSFASLYSFNSKFKMSDYRDIKWFKKIRKLNDEKITNSEGKEEIVYKETKLIPRDECRELKNIARKNENRIDEDYFKAFELHALMQELNWFSNRFDTKFTLVLNNLSNRFERSWLIPLGSILVLGFILFVPYFYSTSSICDSNNSLFDYLRYYWLFINPIHSFNLFPDRDASGLTYFIDTLHRVLNYYLIYQFVAAFRKFRRT